jgi:hypothetical protein
MKRPLVSLLLILATAASLSAQGTPATRAAQVVVVELEKSLAKARTQLAEIKSILAAAPACPVTVCPTCPPPTVCPTCPPPVVCPTDPEQPTACVVSPWGAWSACTASGSTTTGTRTRTRTVVTPASVGGTPCPELVETETCSIALPAAGTVRTAAELTAAIKVAGVYRLEPGTYVGNFTAAVDGVTLIGATLPDGRVAPNATAAYKLVPANSSLSTLTIMASRVRVSGIYIAQGAAGTPVVSVGSPDVADPLLLPDDVTLDRIEIHAGALGGLRGIAAHTRKFTLTNSLVTGFWWQGADSQAFYSCNGPGPYTLVNNQLQASGENILFGGGSTRSAANIPSDITVTDNLLDKPEEWRTKAGAVKNSFELKIGRRVLFERNIIRGMWASAQSGHAIVLTPRNQYGDSPWVVVEDVIIRRNIVTGHTDGFLVNILGKDDTPGRISQQTARITIEHNHADSKQGIKVNRGVAGWLRVRNNTFPNVSKAAWSFEPTTDGILTPCEWTNNVFSAGIYGILGGASGSGTTALGVFCEPGYQVTGNVIEMPVRSIWPSLGNKFLSGPGLLAPLLDENGRYREDPSKGWDGALSGSF